MPGCIFCAIVEGSAPQQRIYEDEHAVAFMDINPATRGHVVVIPRAHSDNLLDVSEEDLAATMAAVRRLVERMNETIEPDGFNILNNMGRAAWQSIFHFHVHVIPRYVDDPLQLPWLPEPADPEELAAVAAELRR